ncbi:MAG: DNA mismatch endonuclease Vsr [Methylotenera sp.]|uniref:very short patch repair endonuclease n=1 Tax=Methylotenera sp. TaxID=2051956 RepID=UPI00273394CA|nr:DNA mismatch endonuclease Vsr [Methylotenera sp.]MDP2102098.1 DNA mismatch endonuclease Vsr [Methylotenera sp.]MDP2281058.1 DNA mismatch endonuclease Vsr [Methylotenera sp.]MDP3061153.1 DNA mismatch endonuclease Vsr [Methylotenera sp.]MDP3210922.1 DNA mismatch endonuclease Vsr [Methylotenera sp.]
MVDLQTHEQRSLNMAAIKASNTLPEIYIRKILFSEGFRYRLNQKNLPGKPDIVLAKHKTVVFIHGCFWHKHQCHLGSTPKTNTDFWIKKFNSNVDRDQRNVQSLLELGWNIVIIWECAIKGKFKLPENSLRSILLSSIRDSTNRLINICGSKI